jgi:hypothetical protein
MIADTEEGFPVKAKPDGGDDDDDDDGDDDNEGDDDADTPYIPSFGDEEEGQTNVNGGEGKYPGETVTSIKLYLEGNTTDEVSELELAPEETVQLLAVTEPAGAEVQWWSDPASAVTVSDNGLVTMNNGEAVVHAKAGGKQAYCAVKLKQGSEGPGLYLMKMEGDELVNGGAVENYTGNENTENHTLTAALSWIGTYGENSKHYLILLGASYETTENYTVNKTGVTVTLKGTQSGNMENNITITKNNTGSLLSVGGELVLEDITLAGYSANTAALVSVSGKLTMKTGSRITGNTTSAAATGGGVYVTGNFIMEDGSIDNNKATNGNGGGVYNQGTFTMKGGTVKSNETKKYGGGVFNINSGSLFIEGGNIQINYGEAGGGVYIKTGTFNMSKDAQISDNYVNTGTNPFGGGVAMESGTAEMSGGVIQNNKVISANTNKGGGGIYIHKGTLTMSGTAVVKGNSALSGGGIFINNDAIAKFIMQGGSIEGNRATAKGAAVYKGNTTATFYKTGGIIYGTEAENGQANKKPDGVDDAVHSIEMKSTSPYYYDSTAGNDVDLNYVSDSDKSNNWSS